MIKQNPFRILGISPTATEREIQKQVTKTTRYAEVGKQISFDTDFSFIGDLKRDKESISIASSAIEQPLNRLVHSLFWFWNANHIDAAAFDNLSKDHTEKATEIWGKVVKDGDVSTKNLSCLFNLKSLYVAQSLKDNSLDSKLFIKGVLLAGKFFNHSELDSYTKQVVGEHINVSSQELEIKYITSIYSTVKLFLKKKNGITTDDFLSGFDTFSKKSREYISAKFTGDPIKKIEDQIYTTSEFREQNPIEALSFGETLFKNTKSQLESLSKILGKEDLKYQMLANKLANEILQCGIDYFNKLREEEQAKDEDGKKVLKLCKLAKKMVAGFESQTSARIDENYQIISDWVNDSSRELIAAFNKAMEVFESFDNWKGGGIKGPPGASDWGRPDLIEAANTLVKVMKKSPNYLDPSNFKYGAKYISNYYNHTGGDYFSQEYFSQIEICLSKMENVPEHYKIVQERGIAMHENLITSNVEVDHDKFWNEVYEHHYKLRFNDGSLSIDEINLETNNFKLILDEIEKVMEIIKKTKCDFDLQTFCEYYAVKRSLEGLLSFKNKYSEKLNPQNTKATGDESRRNTKSQEFLSFSNHAAQLIIAMAIKHVNNISNSEKRCLTLFQKIKTVFMEEDTRANILKNEVIIRANMRINEKNKSYEQEKAFHERFKNSSSGGCYIATMVYGDYEHPQVLVLREFRDNFLGKFLLGRSFIRFYYKYSPGWVKSLEHNKMINKSIEKVLNAFIKIFK